MSHRWLGQLGLDRPARRAWALYDLAISGFNSVIVTAVFPVYFATVAAKGLDPAVATARFGLVTTAALAFTAFLSPVLGVIADALAWKKRLLAATMAIGVAAVATMTLVGPGDWKLAALCFAMANIGANASFSLYDSLLPHLASREEMDRLSTAGYAVGYLGSAVLLGLILTMIQHPVRFHLADAGVATRVGFGLVASWWAVFALPLFRRVPEPPADPQLASAGPGVRSVVRQLRATILALRRFPQAFLLLAAFLIYNDGIGTIIRMAGIYGAELGIPQASLIGSILLVQVVGVPAAFGMGMLSGRVGTKRMILIGLGLYGVISVLGYRMRTAHDFLMLALLVGLVQGGTQALSRSLFASLIPRARSGEFFGLFAVFEKFAGILGPLVFSVVVQASGSSRNAILAVIAFFVVGGALLGRVRVAEGQAAAHAADAEDARRAAAAAEAAA
jgi:MFS transporter, UMF1 family